ncbi:MAG: hypothetical protein WA979_13980, partial [Pacificimonas sp.]
QEWHAPAGGMVSHAIATAPRPAHLARLRQENGTPAFADDSFVTLFTLLPEVEARLDAMCRALPGLDGTAGGGDAPTRPRIRTLALEIAGVTLSQIAAFIPGGIPPDLTDDDRRAAYLGLFKKAGTELGNAAKPVTVLRRPAGDAAILTAPGAASLGGSLWAFDHRGRAVDPGAVAAWWAHLGETAFTNLWASEDAADQRTAAVDDFRSVHVVTAHEGPLPSEQRDRLAFDNLDQVAGSRALYAADVSGSAPTIAMSGDVPPDHDPLPVPRIALLPHGRYEELTTTARPLFQAWPDAAWPANLRRDFARIAVVDVEQHLVGLDRSDPAQASDRARVGVARNTAPTPWQTRADAGTAAVMSILRGGDAIAMAPVMDFGWSALTAAASTAEAPAERLPFTVHALTGEGTETSGVASGQRVLFRFENEETPLSERTWIRLHPNGLDRETGQRFPMDGGGGRVGADGVAHVVALLPDGSAAPEADMSFEAVVVTDTGARHIPELRFPRPAILSGTRLDVGAPPNVPAGFTLYIAETGTSLTRGAAGYGGGQTLIAIPDDPGAEDYALVDLTSLHASDYAADILRQAAGASDTLIVTTPAFANTDDGDVTGGDIGLLPARIVHRDRDGLTDSITTFGRPVPTMERRELAAVDIANAIGLIGGAPGYDWLHEQPPALHGHPMMPGAAEVHAVAAGIAGPAAVPLFEALAERAASNIVEFIETAQAAPTAPADPGGPSGHVAILQTMTRGIAGDAAIRALAAADLTPGQAWLDIKQTVEDTINAVPGVDVDLDTVLDSPDFENEYLAGAIDRLIRLTKDGAVEAATSLTAAIARAEDFIYLETPAIDTLADPAGDGTLLSKMLARLTERPGLRLIIACPENFMPGLPKPMIAVRRAAISAAVDGLQPVRDRAVVFTPVAGVERPLHMATTTVIVDDAYVLTGSAHPWRRGLTFDSALSVAGFDETLTDGRPASIAALRRTLVGNMLGVGAALAPGDPAELVTAIHKMQRAGGLGRIKPAAFPAIPHDADMERQQIWNPDGGTGGIADAYLFFNDLISGAVKDEVSSAVR